MNRHAWIDEQLAAVPMFEGLSKKQLRRISRLMTRIDRPAGQVLTTEGQSGHEFFIVLEGEVEVRQGDRVVATRGPGEYVGEIALLDKRRRTAPVLATTPVSVEVLSRREFMSLLVQAPEPVRADPGDHGAAARRPRDSGADCVAAGP
jgi:CRP/FNR family transcriptional regulator, cyclic AMP receptor protein